jgi:hypothetical protein
MLQVVVIADGATTYFSGEVRGLRYTEYVPGKWTCAVTAHDTGAAASVSQAPFALSDLAAGVTYQRVLTGAIQTAYCFWRLGESTGTVADDIRDMRDGTYQGTPTLGVTSAMPDQTDTAITLNGSSQWVDVGAYMLAGQTNFSIAAWGKTSYSGAQQVIYAERTAAGTGAWVLFYLDTNGRPTLQYRDNAGTSDTIVALSGNWADGAWHHFAVTKAGTDVWIYVDGGYVRHTTLTANDTLTGTLLAKIGKDAYDGHYWTGSLDEVGIWHVTLTADEVYALYACQTVRRYQSLITDSQWGDGFGETMTATVVTLESGLAPGQVMGIASVNLLAGMAAYTVQELTITWDANDHLRFTAQVGDAPLHLASAFP